MTGPPSEDELFAEAAQLALHFHWKLNDILDLEHADRRRFLRQINAVTANAP